MSKIEQQLIKPSKTAQKPSDNSRNRTKTCCNSRNLAKTVYFNFLSSCIIIAMPMMAAPVSAMGCAKNTPFNSK